MSTRLRPDPRRHRDWVRIEKVASRACARPRPCFLFPRPCEPWVNEPEFLRCGKKMSVCGASMSAFRLGRPGLRPG